MQILYDKHIYEIRYANHARAGLVRFASKRLYNALIDPRTGKYKGKLEKRIAEDLYGFVDVEIISKYKDDDFDQYVSDNFI